MRLLICALFAALLYLPGLGHPALWEPDEGRYAEIAREMVLSHDYVTPRDNWVRYFEKPPLVYWAEAGSITLFGENELAIRLPAALATIAEVVVTAALGEAMFGAAIGLAAGLVLATSPLAFGFARFATLDPALALFITASLGAFWAASRTPAFRSSSSYRWILASSAMAALGTLAKGPVALLLPGAIGLAWLVTERRTREALRLPWLSAVALYAAITAPWFVLAARRNPDFLRFFFIHEHIDRYLVNSEHSWGPYFFVLVAIAGMWPWICFVPAGIWHFWQRRQPGSEAEMVRDEPYRSSAHFLLWWFGIILVFFSIPRAKLGSYILPAFPSLAILAGYALCRLRLMAARNRRLLFGTIALANLVVLIAAIIARANLDADLTRTLLAEAVFGAGILAAASFAALAMVWQERGSPAAIGLLSVGVLIVLGVSLNARIQAQPLGSYRQLAREIAPYLGPDCRLASYRHFVQSLPFYTGHRETLVDYRGELAPFARTLEGHQGFIATDADLARVWHGPECVVLVVNRRDLGRAQAILGRDATVIGCEGKKLAIYNRVSPTDAAERCAVDWPAREPLGFTAR